MCIFFLLQTAPDEDNILRYIDEVRIYLKEKYRVNFSDSLTLAWLLDVNATPDDSNVIAINFYVNSNKEIKVSQTFNYEMGNGFATLSIQNNTAVTFVPEGAATQIQLAYNSNSPNMSFESKEYGSDSLLNKNISIAFSEFSCGGLGFPLGINLRDDFKAFF